VAQRSERCPHCSFVGADVLRYERRPGVVVTYLICRSCGDDYMTTEEPTEPSPSPDQIKIKTRIVDA